MITYVEATFLGHEAGDFHIKHTYQLRIVQHWRQKLTITATHGYDFKPIRDLSRVYDHLGEFLKDWQILKVVDGPLATFGGDGSTA